MTKKKIRSKHAKHLKRVKHGVSVEHFRVAIYGSARIKRGDKTYRLVYDLAKQIARDHIDVVTGGGPGLMNAAAHGHHAGRRKNSDVKSIGLAIHLPHEQRTSYHLDIKKEFHNFSDRLDNFLKLSNIFVVAPGGIGTILELFYSWQLIQVHKKSDIPIICIGKMWKPLIKWVLDHPTKNRLMKKEDVHTIFLVNNAKDAMKIIREAKELYESGTKDTRKNLSVKLKRKLGVKWLR